MSTPESAGPAASRFQTDQSNTVHKLDSKCIASTGDSFCKTIAECNPDTSYPAVPGRPQFGDESNCFQSAQLSADGATLVTSNEDWGLRSFLLPQATTEPTSPSDHPLPSTAHTTQSQPSRALSSASYPLFNSSDLNTTTSLLSSPSLPIRLQNVFAPYTHATYPWLNPRTEAYIAPHSLLFTPDGTRFVAGAKEALAVFDSSRDGQGPVAEVRTRRGRRERKYGTSWGECAGLVSASAMRGDDGSLAAGTTRRQIGFWAACGLGEVVATFDLGLEDGGGKGEMGNGVSQLKWSPDGRYLFVAERQSDGLAVYDIRVQGRRSAWLKGRRADATQKSGFDVVGDGAGCDVWAGGTDGVVRVWRAASGKEGEVQPDEEVQVARASVSNVLIHEQSLITTSGQRRCPQDLVSAEECEVIASPENAMKVWSF